jgi:uncharacterized membrane protein
MTKGRLEAFSDGVLAIIITIMVLELHVPQQADPGALRPLLPVLMSYVLSFLFLGIYWSNHHHMLQAVTRVDGRVLWANLHLLFWLSLVPFVTGWIGETHFGTWPVALYSCVFLLAAIAYYVLAKTLVSLHGADSTIARALGRDFKGKTSIASYLVAIPLAFVRPVLSLALILAVAILWLVPDRRIERTLDRDRVSSE